MSDGCSEPSATCRQERASSPGAVRFAVEKGAPEFVAKLAVPPSPAALSAWPSAPRVPAPSLAAHRCPLHLLVEAFAEAQLDRSATRRPFSVPDSRNAGRPDFWRRTGGCGRVSSLQHLQTGRAPPAGGICETVYRLREWALRPLDRVPGRGQALFCLDPHGCSGLTVEMDRCQTGDQSI